jgi:hypothetical protein
MGHIRLFRRTQHLLDLAGGLLLLPRDQGQIPRGGTLKQSKCDRITDYTARRHVCLRSLQPQEPGEAFLD